MVDKAIEPGVEGWLGQIRHRGGWMDFARSVEGPARKWQSADPVDRRVVHWISREVLIDAEPEAFPLSLGDRKTLADLLWDALGETAPEAWHDYPGTVKLLERLAVTDLQIDAAKGFRRDLDGGY
jgi:hypothetical protein